MTCECAVCTYWREVEIQLDKLAPEQRKFFEDMYERLCNAENDAAFNQLMRSEAERKAADASWATNPDRMGGQFTQDEINDTGWR